MYDRLWLQPQIDSLCSFISVIRDTGNDAFAIGFFLDRVWHPANIDNETIDRNQPDGWMGG